MALAQLACSSGCLAYFLLTNVMFLEPDSYLAPFLRYSLREIRNRNIWLPLLCLNLSIEGSSGTISVKFSVDVSGWPGYTKWRRNIAENFNRLKDCLALGDRLRHHVATGCHMTFFERLLLLKANMKAYKHMLPWQ